MKPTFQNQFSEGFHKPFAASLFSSLIFCSLIIVIIDLSCKRDKNENPFSAEKFSGMCYGPYRDNEDPDLGVHPTVEELREDISFIRNLTSAIRTYGVTENLSQIPLLCQQNDLDCYPGAWISKIPCENEKQIEGLKAIAQQDLSHVKGFIVGNEVLLRNDIPESQLIDYINKVKAETGLPVATAEICSEWLSHPNLVQAVDVMFVHIYPYWDGVAIENAMNHILNKWNELKAHYPEKKMVIGETGWPSAGEIRGMAIPSEENQRTFISGFLDLAKENDIPYFFFEIFDEKWKSKFENQVGSHWGIYNSDGSLKMYLTNLIPVTARNGISRPARIVNPTIPSLPLYVYFDGCHSKNGFFASGWMGELADLAGNDTIIFNPLDIINESDTTYPFSGSSCIRISYNPSPDKWGGIYWQFPINNWGSYPGYDLSAYSGGSDTVALSFWARGKEGGEKIEFKTGGINQTELPYRDTYGPISTGVLSLSMEWQKHTIVLTNQNLNMVIGGFCWITDGYQNPGGVTFYLDEIVFDRLHKTHDNSGM